MTTEQFYELWEKFSYSTITQELPECVEQFCAENEITVDYFIAEFL